MYENSIQTEALNAMVDVIRGTNLKPASSESLAAFFESRSDLSGTLYLGYPIIGTAEGSFQIDSLFVSPDKGLVIFHQIEGTTAEHIEEIQDESYTKLQAKLMQYTNLTKRRHLMVEINVATWAPACQEQDLEIDDDYPVLRSAAELEAFLDEVKWDNFEYFEKLVAAIQSVSNIRSGKRRNYVQQSNSRGAKLKLLEDTIANLDRSQGAAVIETADGVQRIRGLAGSGKTTVLALKAAYLHAKHPDWNIAVTFYTQALKGQFEKLITTFSYEHKNEEPDWDKISIIHSWGSPRMEGVYYNICQWHNIEYFDFATARNRARGREFEYVCKEALAQIHDFEEHYDAILIDEAQDVPPSFFQLCYGLVREPKRLIYAYDELQNLGGTSMVSPEELFGHNAEGVPLVSLRNEQGKPKRDIILDVCYRNSRPLLSAAHALGFGIYRDEGLVQLFEHESLWREIGYEVADGKLQAGEHVRLVRQPKTSPEFLEKHSPLDDLVQFQTFQNNDEQMYWLTDQIETNLKQDELQPDDLIVIHPDPKTAREAFGLIRSILFARGINSHIAGVTTTPDEFFVSDSVVFTSIYRAKGNEAAMVYVINAQWCSRGYAFPRNSLFTAMTRSKAWVRVCGYNQGSDSIDRLIHEYEQVKDNHFALEFNYPTEQERQRLTLVNRDMSPQELERRQDILSGFDRLTEALDSGS
ncbi:ATP-binding domain-containing protein [Candidatus Entotheonella palauensis]|uniref:ATP-binding domain-containing protein n=1 Tax=Candidatus Entotheonella palauensis TaxID=93172 RepID=UPI000B7D1832|nr:ATP-binding domain-containing protein [Candidatus Entotheonella palauensis]